MIRADKNNSPRKIEECFFWIRLNCQGTGHIVFCTSRLERVEQKVTFPFCLIVPMKLQHQIENTTKNNNMNSAATQQKPNISQTDRSWPFFFFFFKRFTILHSFHIVVVQKDINLDSFASICVRLISSAELFVFFVCSSSASLRCFQSFFCYLSVFLVYFHNNE